MKVLKPWKNFLINIIIQLESPNRVMGGVVIWQNRKDKKCLIAESKVML